MSTERINAESFYAEYHGHKVHDLKKLLPILRESSDRLLWTAGDSSLDNKHWFNDTAPAIGVYSSMLYPPRSKQDITYWLNYLCETQSTAGKPKTAAINTAVEATTLNERTLRLRPQDVFLRDNLKENDILVVSIGGNDIALMPMPCTILSILGALCLPAACLERTSTCGTVPVDDCCCGCGPSLCSCACALPPCLGYFRHLFGTRVQKYIEALTAKTKPAKILVCTIYYPDETVVPSWATPALGALGYNYNPAKLQLLIRLVHQHATSTIRIRGTQVIPVPLFKVLDGRTSSDYDSRVEPSPSGGRKIAEFLLRFIEDNPGAATLTTASPTSALIVDRS